jgi:hypothetical protein
MIEQLAAIGKLRSLVAAAERGDAVAAEKVRLMLAIIVGTASSHGLTLVAKSVLEIADEVLANLAERN